MDRTPGVDVLRQLRLDPAWRISSSCCRPPCVAPRLAPRAYGASLAYFNAPNGSSTLLDRLLYADIKTYLVELLMKQDQMSMAASIESRVPFLDHKLVEFARDACPTSGSSMAGRPSACCASR